MIKKYKIGSVLSNPYCTDEKIVGKWIDGKYIYRKIIKVEDVAKGTTDIDVSELNIDNVIFMTGIRNRVVVSSSSKNYTFTMPYTDNDVGSYHFLYYENTIRINTNIVSNLIILFLEYTKNE